jgi:Helix-turn-helix domain
MSYKEGHARGIADETRRRLPMPPRNSERAGAPLAVFGAMLRFYRSQAGLSQAEVAARAYVSHDVISKSEALSKGSSLTRCPVVLSRSRRAIPFLPLRVQL